MRTILASLQKQQVLIGIYCYEFTMSLQKRMTTSAHKTPKHTRKFVAKLCLMVASSCGAHTQNAVKNNSKPVYGTKSRAVARARAFHWVSMWFGRAYARVHEFKHCFYYVDYGFTAFLRLFAFHFFRQLDGHEQRHYHCHIRASKTMRVLRVAAIHAHRHLEHSSAVLCLHLYGKPKQ